MEIVRRLLKPTTPYFRRSVSIFYCYMVIACLYATCGLGQDQPSAARITQDFTTDGSRLNVSVIDTYSRSLQDKIYLSDASFKLLCIDTGSSRLTNLKWALVDPFSNVIKPVLPIKSTLSSNGRELTYSTFNIDENEGGYYVCVADDSSNNNRQIRSERLVLNIISPRALAVSQPSNAVHRRNSLSISDAKLECTVIMRTPLPVIWSFMPFEAGSQSNIIDASPASVNGTTDNVVAKYNTEDGGQVSSNLETGNYCCRNLHAILAATLYFALHCLFLR